MTRHSNVLRWLAVVHLSLATPLLAQQEAGPVVYVGQFASLGDRGAVPGFGSSVLDELDQRLVAEGTYLLARWDSVIAKLPPTIKLSTQQFLAPCGTIDRQLATLAYVGRVEAGICGGLEELADGKHRLTGFSWSSGGPPESEVGPFVVSTPAEAADRLAELIKAIPRRPAMDLSPRDLNR